MDLLKLCVRMFSKPLSPINLINDTRTLIYCFSHNTNSISLMCEGLKKYNINEVYIIKNSRSMSGVQEYNEVVEEYKKFGVKTILIPFEQDFINTKNESEVVVDYAFKNNFKNIVVIAPTFHLLRASMTLISSAIEKGLNFKVYPIISEIDNWNEKYLTHQGTTYNIMENILDLELERIIKYTEKGDIKSTRDIWQYMDKN